MRFEKLCGLGENACNMHNFLLFKWVKDSVSCVENASATLICTTLGKASCANQFYMAAPAQHFILHFFPERFISDEENRQFHI